MKSQLSLLKYALICFTVLSCAALQKSGSEGEKSAADMKYSFDTEGLLEGRVIASQDANDCPFVIEVLNKKLPYYLDPVNLDEEFKKDSLEIFFEYTGMRMANRCKKALPVTLSNVHFK